MTMEMNEGGAYRPVTSRISYLIGVPSEYLDQMERGEYDKQRPYRIIRQMNKLRTAIMTDFDKINEQFQAGKHFDEIPETQRVYLKLVKEHAEVQKEYSLSRTIININNWIFGMINKIMPDFPESAHREWIKDILIMPRGNSVDGIRLAIKKYTDNRAHYPYQMYLNWDFALTTEADKLHNILLNDEYFEQVLAERYAPVSGSEDAKNFFDTAEKVAVIVDCENSEPSKLFSMIRDIGRKDIKVILIDDVNTTPMWKDFAGLANEIGVPTEREEIQRLKAEKSLVDLRMVARACEEHYQRGVDSLVLVTSDSDIWALIQSLPAARFVVVPERSKGGTSIFSALTEHNIPCWFLDNYAEDEELMDRAMVRMANELLAQKAVSLEDLALDAASALMTFLPQNKMQFYAKKWTKKLVCVNDEEVGTAAMKIAEDETNPAETFGDKPEEPSEDSVEETAALFEDPEDGDTEPEDDEEEDDEELDEDIDIMVPRKITPMNVPKRNIPAKKGKKKKASSKKKKRR